MGKSCIFSDFARAGCVSISSVVLEAGEDALARFPHNMEPTFRRLGLPTLLQCGENLHSKRVGKMWDYTLNEWRRCGTTL